MSAFLALYDKELRGLFLQPIAWVLMAVFLLVVGYTFATSLALTRIAALSQVIFQASTVLLLLIPLITMRLLAEERRHGTLEFLLATPVREHQVVLAKFAASMTLTCAMLAPTVAYPVVLAWFGQPEWGPIYSGYLGLLLLASFMNALGLALSALTSNQVIAATVTLGLSLLLWMVDSLSALLPTPWDERLLHFSLLAHFTPFATGAMYLSDAGFFIAGTLFALFCATRAVAQR